MEIRRVAVTPFSGQRSGTSGLRKKGDPVDGSISAHQGICVEFAGGKRLVYRLSGTGTEGATLRVYLERCEPNPARHGLAANIALPPLARSSVALADIEGMTGRPKPNVVA
jgi:phosphoglucomutase